MTDDQVRLWFSKWLGPDAGIITVVVMTRHSVHTLTLIKDLGRHNGNATKNLSVVDVCIGSVERNRSHSQMWLKLNKGVEKGQTSRHILDLQCT